MAEKLGCWKSLRLMFLWVFHTLLYQVISLYYYVLMVNINYFLRNNNFVEKKQRLWNRTFCGSVSTHTIVYYSRYEYSYKTIAYYMCNIYSDENAKHKLVFIIIVHACIYPIYTYILIVDNKNLKKIMGWNLRDNILDEGMWRMIYMLFVSDQKGDDQMGSKRKKEMRVWILCCGLDDDCLYNKTSVKS